MRPELAAGPEPVVFPGPLYERLVAETRRRYPRKVFGYLLSATSPAEPTDFILFEDNIRNSSGWQPEFHSYGEYFVNHADAGFVATPEESWRVQKEIWARGLFEVGVLHSHQRHPANFSLIDWDMHRQRFSDLWHLIISLRNPELPQVRAFAVADDSVRELPLWVTVAPSEQAGSPPATAAPLLTDTVATDTTVLIDTTVLTDTAKVTLRKLSALDRAGRPDPGRAAEIIQAIEVLAASPRPGDRDDLAEILAAGLRRGSAERYAEHVAPLMAAIGPARFEMGSQRAGSGHFYGEYPRHPCELSPFEIMRVHVTCGLYARLDPAAGGGAGAARDLPVTGVSWWQAALFALWMGARLPTEAEWEYSAGAGAASDWCCESEAELRRYAWYCVNARDQLQPVATRAPNRLGLHDLHGNAWEWCLDDYDQDCYASAPRADPVHRAAPGPGPRPDKVARGGSANGLAEMCRTRYRFHEPAGFRAADLGFRLARSW